MPSPSGLEIQVQEAGLVLGWKLFAALAATFLGIYVGMVVAPLESEYEELKRQQTVIVQELASIKATLNELNNHAILDDSNGVVVERRLEKVENNIELLQRGVNDHLLQHATERADRVRGQ